MSESAEVKDFRIIAWAVDGTICYHVVRLDLEGAMVEADRFYYKAQAEQYIERAILNEKLSTCLEGSRHQPYWLSELLREAGLEAIAKMVYNLPILFDDEEDGRYHGRIAGSELYLTVTWHGELIEVIYAS